MKSSPQYTALCMVQNAALTAAGFLDATAERVTKDELTVSEIVSRLNDCAAGLRDRSQAANDRFFNHPRTDAANQSPPRETQK